MQGGLTILEACQLAAVSRASFYRRWQTRQPKEEDLAVRNRIQEFALKYRHYGYRPITRLLKREGWQVNHKRVLRLMREDNLLSLRRKKFVVPTTDSDHQWQVYPNLARKMHVSGVDQLWAADITYVRLQREFIYVAVILDVYSRRVVGWAISRQLDSTVAQQALAQAIRTRKPAASGLVHHSDRGWQYACGDYVKLLEQHGIEISMSRPGNPYDNAFAETFMKTLKAEEVHARQYRSFAEAQQSIGQFIDAFYNRERLHSALGYCSPLEFETLLGTPAIAKRASSRVENFVRSKPKQTRGQERKAGSGGRISTASTGRRDY